MRGLTSGSKRNMRKRQDQQNNWIFLDNCLYFAYNKGSSYMTDGIRGSPRGSVGVYYADRLGNSVSYWVALFCYPAANF